MAIIGDSKDIVRQDIESLAGAGAALLMLGAMVVHLRRRESKAIGGPVLLALLGVFVVVSRFGIVGS